MTTHHVSPAGSATNDGTASSPWSLEHATDMRNEKLHPGDTVLLHGGVYGGKWALMRSGEVGAPIVYRPFGDGRVVLDGKDTRLGKLRYEVVTLEAKHVWLRDVEIMSSEPTRLTSLAGTTDDNLIRRGGSVATQGHYVSDAGTGCKIINCLIHDTNGGPGQLEHSNDAEIYGCIIFNNGWHSTGDGGHGHGLYLQNNGAPGKEAGDNIIFGNGGDAYGIHFYGSGNANLKHGNFEGNVSLQNNLMGGNAPLSNLIFIDNFTFGAWTRIGWDSGAAGVRNVGSLIEGNYLVGGYRGLSVFKHTGAVIRDNTVIGGLEVLPFIGNTSQNNVTEKPTKNAVFVRPNQYDPNRFHLIIYNWQDHKEVVVTAPLGNDDEWFIRDAFSPLATPIKTGRGPTIRVPMTGLVAAQPSGNAPWKVAHPGPAFGTFIVQRVGNGTVVPPVEPPVEPPIEPPPPPPPLPGEDRADLVEARRLLDKYILRTKP